MKKKLIIITKLYFSTPYIFLIYKIFNKGEFSLLKFIILTILFISLYHIINNKKWIYKLTIIIAIYFGIVIPIISLTVKGKELDIYSNSNTYSDILNLLFLFGFIILYYLNQRNFKNKEVN